MTGWNREIGIGIGNSPHGNAMMMDGWMDATDDESLVRVHTLGGKEEIKKNV